jgi:hypothetical protein
LKAGSNVVSSKLSALQHDLIEAFFLTGGAALAGYHLGHRFTDDVDLFSPPSEPMEFAVQRVRRAAAAIGATLEPIQEAPELRRFAVQRSNDTTVVDLVIDPAPQLVVDKEWVGRVRLDPQREIAANKITALLGRTAHAISSTFLHCSTEDRRWRPRWSMRGPKALRSTREPWPGFYRNGASDPTYRCRWAFPSMTSNVCAHS